MNDFKKVWIILVTLAVLVAAGSLPTLPRKSDQAELPLLAGAQIEPATLSIFDRACSDCHSEATRYPWYAYIAPVSWLIEHDVNEGRKHLNLSHWNDYPLVRKERSLSEIANQVKDHEMPLREYRLLHPEAGLSELDVDTIFRWTQAERRRLIAESQR